MTRRAFGFASLREITGSDLDFSDLAIVLKQHEKPNILAWPCDIIASSWYRHPNILTCDIIASRNRGPHRRPVLYQTALFKEVQCNPATLQRASKPLRV